MKQQQLWLYTFSNLVAGLGAQTYAFALSFYILKETGSALGFAVQLIANVVPRTLMSPLFGVWADRYAKKKLLLISQAMSIGIVSILLIFISLKGIALPLLYVTTAFLSMTSACTSITFSASITQLFSKDMIQRATSMNQLAISSAALISPIVGGVLYGLFTFEQILILFIVLFSLAWLMNTQLIFQPVATLSITETNEQMMQAMKDGWQYVKKHPFAFRFMLLTLALNFIFSAYEVGYSFTVIQTFGLSSQAFGLTQAGFALGMLVTSIVIASLPPIQRPLILVKYFLMGTGLVILFVTLPFRFTLTPIALILYFFSLEIALGVCVTAVNTITLTLLQQVVEDSMKGRFFGLLESFALAIAPIAFILFGFLYDQFSAQWLMIGIGVSCILFVSISLSRRNIQSLTQRMEQL